MFGFKPRLLAPYCPKLDLLLLKNALKSQLWPSGRWQ